MSLKNIVIYLEERGDYNWNDNKTTECPLRVYIKATNFDEENVYFEVLVATNTVEHFNPKKYVETIRVFLKELSKEEIEKIDTSNPLSQWDIYDIPVEKQIDMFLGDLIGLDGDLNYENISYGQLAARIIPEDKNNYTEAGQEMRIYKRLQVALKLNYILGDNIGNIDSCNLKFVNKTIYRYEDLFHVCLKQIKGIQ